MTKHVSIALLLTTLAGLSTTIGSLIGLVLRDPGPQFMGFTLGFSAGVMILLSFVELLQESIESIGFVWANAAFFLGMTCIFIVDFVVPHEYIGQHDYNHGQGHSRDGLMRTGLFVALGIGIHNFPEGMATFAGAVSDVRLGIAIALAIAIHNIPEGLAISVPIYAATGSRGKAFLWSFLSGVSEPVGAAVAAVFLVRFLTPTVLACLLAGVGGTMVSIALDELVPAAKSYGRHHTPIVGVICGMLVMALSLWMLKG